MTRAEAQALADRLLEHPQVEIAQLTLSYPERWAKEADAWDVVIRDHRFGWFRLQNEQAAAHYYLTYTGEDDR